MCSILAVGCSSLFIASTLPPDDLYRTDNRQVVISRIEAEAVADAQGASYQADYGSADGYTSIVADNYESAYARRLYGFNSPTYKLPSSYYRLAGNSTMFYATAYDPAYYNIMVSGDQVWVEPKYITSMFGSWGATNVTYGIYSSPWNYGWSYGASPFYYSWWGYPRYSWYDWNWNICYNPWYYDWCWGYPSYGYHPHYPGFMPPHPPHYRPSSRPDYLSGSRPNHGFVVTGSGASSGPSSGNLNGSRGTTGSRYTSPTSNKNYGSVTVTPGSNRGTVSTGINSNSSYQSSGLSAGGTVRPSTNSGTNRGTTSGSSGSNFRQGSSSGRGTSSSSSGSSSSYRGGSSSSSYRSGSSSSSSSSYRSGNSSSSSSSYRSGSSSSSSSRSSYSGGSSRGSSGSSSSGGGTTSSRR